MKFDKMSLANAFALTTAIVWVVCTVFVAIFPGLSLIISKMWMHGMNIEVMGNWNLNIGNFLIGGASMVIAAWVTGWIFGWSWEYVSKKK